ncbi:MAG: MmcQ/YjbR family DNA-binding protein [Bacteroidetes bacterium]|nr:MmcQ/YjbR family DNA-binding protein [Bacteroidota bacterium]
MTLEDFVEYCLAKPGVTDEFPFGADTLVFKVMGKMFALADAETFDSINLKCEPELAVELREQYDAVKPGYHMNKNHWNTVTVNGDAPDKKIYQWIDLSYNLVVKSLTKKQREALNDL